MLFTALKLYEALKLYVKVIRRSKTQAIILKIRKSSWRVKKRNIDPSLITLVKNLRAIEKRKLGLCENPSSKYKTAGIWGKVSVANGERDFGRATSANLMSKILNFSVDFPKFFEYCVCLYRRLIKRRLL